MGTRGHRRRRIVGATLAGAVASTLTFGAWPSQAKQAITGDAEIGELVAGEVQYVSGTHVWTDYAYDDRGPNTNGLAGGDASYSDDSPGNEADLIQLQAATGQSGDVRVTAVLQTLRDDTEAVIGVGFDVDPTATPQTGAVSVPGGRWANRESLGLEYMAILPTRGTPQLLAWAGNSWSPAGAVSDVVVDRTTNVVSATLPLQPGKATWEAVGVAGPMNDDGSSWDSGEAEIHDLAYLRAEDPTDEVLVALREQVPQLGFVPYQDKDQADVLAGRIPPHRAATLVTFGTRTNSPPNIQQGFNAFLYHSRIPVDEGVRSDPIQYDGIYMPYAVWIPPTVNLDEDPPLLVFLHGANQYQNVNLVHFNNPQSLVVPSPYDVPAVVIFPNGRTTSWGTPLADADALEATADALDRQRLNLDRDRVVLTGVSSGGFGTYHMASRYPDLFTGAYSLVGGSSLIMDEAALENLTNVPFRASNGALDPLVNAAIWRLSADALNAAETVDYRIVLVHNRSHDGPLAEGNCYYLDLLSRDRVLDPTRVRYTKPIDDPERKDYGILPTGAYWVSQMDAHDDAVPASVDLESLAKAPRAVDQHEIFEVGENAVSTADFCGPHPTMRNGTNWSTEGRSFQDGSREDPANALTGSLANLDALTVDAVRAGLDISKPIELDITTDRPTILTLTGGPGGWTKVVQLSPRSPST